MADMPETRDRYRYFVSVATRWNDNDVYGHVNNMVYYGYIDSAVNLYLVREGGLDIHASPVIGVVVESGCRFRRPIAYPDTVDVGIRVGRLGNSSVRYELGLFRAGEDEAAAEGHFVHVFVNRATMRPAPMPTSIRTALARLAPDLTEP